MRFTSFTTLVVASLAAALVIACGDDTQVAGPESLGPQASVDSTGPSSNMGGSDSTGLVEWMTVDTNPPFKETLPPPDSTAAISTSASASVDGAVELVGPETASAVMSGPVPSGTELIVNGGFEAGFGGWTRAAQLGGYQGSNALAWLAAGVDDAPPSLYLACTWVTYPTNSTCQSMPHGEHLNQSGSTGITARETSGTDHQLFQDLTLPPLATGQRITLNYWIRWKNGWLGTVSGSSLTSWQANQQDIVVTLRRPSDNSVIKEYWRASNQPSLERFSGGGSIESANYRQFAFDLTPWANQPVRLQFQTFVHNYFLLMDLDDVSIMVSGPTQQTQTISFNQPSTRIYGDADFPLVATASSGLPVTFSASPADVCAVVSNTAVTITKAGTCTVTASQEGNQTYSPATPVERTFIIQPAPLTVTLDDQRRVYGGGNPTLTGTLIGLVNHDLITPVYSTTADEASPVGQYDITVSLEDPGKRLSNYVVPPLPKGTLHITPAPLTLVVDPKTREYGLPNPVLTGTLQGVQSPKGVFDAITANYATPATPQSRVGPYPITWTLADPQGKLGNYQVPATPPAVLLVTPATLTVVVKNQAMFYGATSLPDLTAPAAGSVTGQRVGDIITGTFSTTATVQSTVGAYPITVALNDPGNKLVNYSVPNPLPIGVLKITYYRAAGASFLQPINLPPDVRSAFKLGSTVPVKFQIFKPDGVTPVSVATARIRYVFGDPTPDEAINESTVSSTGDVGTNFRYDPTSGQYVFNLSTKSPPLGALSQGTWTIYADLDDGTSISALVDLRTK